jgi:CheY-like chemotaxis protein
VSENAGIDYEPGEKSLKNPPTERRPEHHPDTSDVTSRYQETVQVAHNVESEADGVAGSTAEKHKANNPGESDSRRTLLLVEDNLINQKVLRRQLQSRGFEVVTANNGQEAIDAVRARGQKSPDHDANHKTYFDCILMDQEMPIKDGNAATMEIRDLQSQGQAGMSPILGVSANVREAQTRSMLEAGMDEVISKPFRVEDLEKKIQSILPDK